MQKLYQIIFKIASIMNDDISNAYSYDSGMLKVQDIKIKTTTSENFAYNLKLQIKLDLTSTEDFNKAFKLMLPITSR